MIESLTIRAHHLLCMQGYQGKGYSENFVANMNRITSFIRSNPSVQVLLNTDIDSICLECPHYKVQSSQALCLAKSTAANAENRLREKTLLKMLGLEDNREYKIEELFAAVNKRISKRLDADRVYCKDCMWQEVCLWYQSLDK